MGDVSAVGPWFEDVAPGLRLPELRKRPSGVQLFRFSAVTWNAHRIHFDRAYAVDEGYLDVLVHAQLHGCFLTQLVTDWMGPRGRLLGLSWQNRLPAVPGDELICGGTVRATYLRDGLGHVECQLEERNGRGELSAPGTALVILPRRAEPPAPMPESGECTTWRRA